MQKIILLTGISCFVILLTFSQQTFATNTNNSLDISHIFVIAQIIDANKNDIKDGSIVSYSKQGAVISSLAYDLHVFGIVSLNVPATLYSNSHHLGTPVITNGIAYVLVSTRNGVIKKGDKIASSTIPGVGVKAVKSGYIVGMALADYENPDPQHFEKIPIRLTPNYFSSITTFPHSLSDIIKLFELPTIDSRVLRIEYIVAVGIHLVLLILAILAIGLTGQKVLRINPTASSIIYLGIIINIIIAFLIIISTLTVTLFLIRL